MKKLIILIDNNNLFLSSIADLKHYTSMDIAKIKTCFEKNYFDVEILMFSDIDLTKNYQGQYVIYQSSEAIGSFYKRYIEDVIFYLEKKGAITLPRYEYLKAHHNKVFMEMMRFNFSDSSLKTIITRCFGSSYDAENYKPTFPVVIKKTSGSSSDGVFLAKNTNEYLKYIKKAGNIVISTSITNIFIDQIKILSKKIIKYFSSSHSIYLNYITSPVSSPILVQSFIDNLKGDYKVLVFGKKFYTLYRKNRDNDFRASGSGRLYDVKDEEKNGLLNFAKKLTYEINYPILGLDIGFDGAKYHLIEFQMISLGTYTLQASNYWHEYIDEKWVKQIGKSDLEEEFSRSIIDYIASI